VPKGFWVLDPKPKRFHVVETAAALFLGRGEYLTAFPSIDSAACSKLCPDSREPNSQIEFSRIPRLNNLSPDLRKMWISLVRTAKVTNLRFAVVFMFLLLAPSLGQAQIVSFGLSAGTPLNHLLTADNSQVATTGWYTFGPALRVRLPHGLGFDVDFLYKRLDFGFVSDPARAVVHRLELPLLLRYVFSGLPVRPWVHAGMSFNRVIAVDGANVCARGIFGEEFYCTGGKRVAELRHRHTHGPVLGAGLDFGWGRVRLAPELRVTRWVDRNFGTRESSLRSNLTQVELLLGFQF